MLGLEQQLAEWQLKYQSLSQTYFEQIEEISRLTSQAANLNGEINALQETLASLYKALGEFSSTDNLEAVRFPSPTSPSSDQTLIKMEAK